MPPFGVSTVVVSSVSLWCEVGAAFRLMKSTLCVCCLRGETDSRERERPNTHTEAGNETTFREVSVCVVFPPSFFFWLVVAGREGEREKESVGGALRLGIMKEECVLPCAVFRMRK